MGKDLESRKGGFCLLLPVPDNVRRLETALPGSQDGDRAGNPTPVPTMGDGVSSLGQDGTSGIH